MAKIGANLGKALVRRLVGQKGGGRPKAIFTHPSNDKMGPLAMGATPPPMTTVANPLPKKGNF